jgi:imidazolonepropionase-like amidohydrolase
MPHRFPALAAAPAPGEGRLWLTGARLFDGTGGLRMGVTTVRFTGAQGEWLQEARQAMRYGAFRGPRLLTCGRIISATAPGGRFYGTMYREADGPDDMRRAVRDQIRAGADFIKIMTTGARSNEMEDPDRGPRATRASRSRWAATWRSASRWRSSG